MLNSSLSHFKNYFVFLKLKKKDGMKPVTVTSQITYQSQVKFMWEISQSGWVKFVCVPEYFVSCMKVSRLCMKKVPHPLNELHDLNSTM